MAIDIGKYTAPYYLWNIHKKNFTGSMLVSKGQKQKKIYFEHGRPVGAISNLLNECFGRILVSSGKISLADCEESLRRMKKENKQQGIVLLEMGLLNEEGMGEVLDLQLKARIVNLFGWKGAKYNFKADDVKKFTTMDESLTDIILEGNRNILEDIEKELAAFCGKFFKKTTLYDNVLNAFGMKTAPLAISGRGIEDILSSGKDAVALTYALLIARAVDITDTSEDYERLLKFYNKIKKKDHFDVLGVSRSTDTRTIKKSYRKLAKEYHPDFFDKHSSTEVKDYSHRIFSLIDDACKVLTDTTLKEEYEKSLGGGRAATQNSAAKEDSLSIDKVLFAEMEFKKGQTCLSFGNYAAALECFSKAVELHPEDAESHAYMGWAAFNKPGKSEEDTITAKEHILKALDMNEKIAIAHYFIGAIMRAEEDFEGALKEQNQALKYDSTLDEAQREIRVITRKVENNKGLFKKLFSK
ncbi:MAG: DnaJ domain-containing protein [Deltaproteobacteria bacterium]|nr:DnaJ domain-containing protein [Deltaproteobacteria bacterium]